MGSPDGLEIARAIAPLNPTVAVRWRGQGRRQWRQGEEMPYTRNEQLPAWVRKLSKEKQDTYRATFNSAFAQHKDEGKAFRVAAASVQGEAEAGDPIAAIMRQYELGEGQTKLLVFPRGKFKHPEYGAMTFDDEFFEEVKGNYDAKALGETEPFVDVDHDHGKAAGWIKGLSIEPAGLFATVEWTPYGRELIQNDEYRYFALPVDGLVLTPTGWVKMGDLQVEDRVIAADGTPTRVVAVYHQGPKEMFEVKFQDGTSLQCTEDHLWLTKTRGDRRRRRPGTVKTTAMIAKTLHRIDGDGRPNHEIPLTGPVEFDRPEPLRLDPWLMGVLLGDGALAQADAHFTSADEWLVERVREVVTPLGLGVRCHAPNQYSITSGRAAGKPRRGRNAVLNARRYYGLEGRLHDTKFVPEPYLYSSREDRLALIQGLMDTDGSAESNPPTFSATFSTTSDALADAIEFLVQSLGGVTHRKRKPMPRVGNIPPWDITVRLPDHLSPFRMPRKLERWTAGRQRQRRKHPQRFIVGVEPVGVKEAQCITIDHPSSLFVADHFIVTGNSPWWGSYKDPAAGKTFDRVLRGGALTNVPFLKVLPPVELFEFGSEGHRRARRAGRAFALSELLLDEHGESIDAFVNKVRAAFAARYQSAAFGPSPYVMEVYDDHVIACVSANQGMDYYWLPWELDSNEDVIFHPEARYAVQQTWVPVDDQADTTDEEQLAEIRRQQGPIAAVAHVVRRETGRRLCEALASRA